MFSSRVPGNLQANRLAVAYERLRGRGCAVLDLTETNPTRVGLHYDKALLDSLADPRGLTYEPQPFGLPEARRAIAADYGRRGIAIESWQIVLTASTSEAYSLLLKLLCDAGDGVLVPHPSYPLFEHLTRLDGVVGSPYVLDYHGTWEIDIDHLERAVDRRTRAVIVVTPNNPTGSLLKRRELARLAAFCGERSVALVADEVFCEYLLEPPDDGASDLFADADALTFTLGGLSKAVGLPQVKLAWIAIGGAPHLVREALERLELICDTYLSVSTAVQHAADRLLTDGVAVREQIRERVRTNYAALQRLAARHPACRVLRAEGGWSAVVQVPATRNEETLVLELLERTQVRVYPGYFFDFPREAFLVCSLLPEPSVFEEGAGRIFEHIDGMEGAWRVC